MAWWRGLARWGLVLGLAMALVAGFGCSGQKNLDNFRKIKTGMSAEQVREILGEPDRMQEAPGVAGVWEYDARTWYGAYDSGLTVTMLGGRVMLVTLTRSAGK